MLYNLGCWIVCLVLIMALEKFGSANFGNSCIWFTLNLCSIADNAFTVLGNFSQKIFFFLFHCSFYCLCEVLWLGKNFHFVVWLSELEKSFPGRRLPV